MKIYFIQFWYLITICRLGINAILVHQLRNDYTITVLVLVIVFYKSVFVLVIYTKIL